MQFDLDQRTATLSVGEFAGFQVGPRESQGGPAGLWRAQLGTRWHQELRSQASAQREGMEFEIPVTGQIAHRGWLLTLTGRIDQRIPASETTPETLREVKTVSATLPSDGSTLRADYPEYFVQLGTYQILRELEAGKRVRGELVFVEIGSGLVQVVPSLPDDERVVQAKLEAVTEFLDARWRARERLSQLTFRPAFAHPRPGQETTGQELSAALASASRVLFEAPTGFGKTGVMLEAALGAMRQGRFSRLLYLTSKSTGQLQVLRTLQQMTTGLSQGEPLAVWQVRNKAEHCVNHTFRCIRDDCAYLAGASSRWPASGLSRFYLLPGHARDLDALRVGGREAMICPYEITRTALAFNDVWVGDYNYVFSPRSRGVFYEQPGFDPGQSLLLVDEAHNLPARVADAYSHVAMAHEAERVLMELEDLNPSTGLLRAWNAWAHLLAQIPVSDALRLQEEDDVRDTLKRVAEQLMNSGVDYQAMSAESAERLWQIPEMVQWLDDARFGKLLWAPRGGELRLTCLDSAPLIRETLQPYGGVVLASATLEPVDAYQEAIGWKGVNLWSAPSITAPGEARPSEVPFHLRAHAPWREQAYRIAFDLRVDTTYQQRGRHAPVTARSIAQLQERAGAAIAVFFPSYAYAEMIVAELARQHPGVRVAVQPRTADLAEQAAWIEESLILADALFLVLGSSFAESIDTLGGRIHFAMIVGPALPEVNAIQRARAALPSFPNREAAFRQVYQVPGMQKVNQALGRLVRAPGQTARVVLHCRRFGEVSYASLLAREYQLGTNLLDDQDWRSWLENDSGPAVPAPPE